MCSIFIDFRMYRLMYNLTFFQVQMFLSNYLDVNSHSELVVKPTPIFSNIDLNIFFSKKKIQR